VTQKAVGGGGKKIWILQSPVRFWGRSRSNVCTCEFWSSGQVPVKTQYVM